MQGDEPESERGALDDEDAPPFLTPQVGRYQVGEEIGDGAMGRVWRGVDPELGRPVAIKTIKAEYLTRDTREDYLHRFRREARAAGMLSHPHIVRIYDVGEDYFVMELLEGLTLADLLKHKGRLERAEALELLGPLADAIDYAHRCGVIHRDIKPANIFVQPDGRPKLMDFGVARLETSAMTAAGHFFGSPSYMAPEQIAGDHVTARADLFAFAVVAYEALTGQRPFQGEGITSVIYRVVNEAPPPPSSWVEGLPADYDQIFARALAKRPQERFPTASSLLAALRGEDVSSLLGLLVPDGAEPTAPEPEAAVETQDITGTRPEPPPRRWGGPLPWLAAAAAVVALAGVLLARWSSPGTAADVARDSSLRIETVPRGAALWLDGRRMGPSPRVLRDLGRGPHRIRIQLAGHAPAELTLHVTDGMGEVPLRFSLAALSAPLEVRAEDGVTVRVDGEVVGVTPLSGVHLPPGPHQVRLERPGYLPQVHARLARAGEPLVVEGRLVAEPAAARPAESPSGAAEEPAPAAADEPMVLDVAVPPRRVAGQAADYPEAARRLQLEGSVLVAITVEPDGLPGDVRVLESAGSVLDQAVVDSIRTWRFEPPRPDGRPARVRWRYRHTFERR